MLTLTYLSILNVKKGYVLLCFPTCICMSWQTGMLVVVWYADRAHSLRWEGLHLWLNNALLLKVVITLISLKRWQRGSGEKAKISLHLTLQWHTREKILKRSINERFLGHSAEGRHIRRDIPIKIFLLLWISIQLNEYLPVHSFSEPILLCLPANHTCTMQSNYC